MIDLKKQLKEITFQRDYLLSQLKSIASCQYRDKQSTYNLIKMAEMAIQQFPIGPNMKTRYPTLMNSFVMMRENPEHVNSHCVSNCIKHAEQAITDLESQIDQLVAALEGVIKVADRATLEFDAARAAVLRSKVE